MQFVYIFIKAVSKPPQSEKIGAVSFCKGENELTVVIAK
jgi:hypothetical protein